ncbi:hypothetical protein C0Q44_25990 [Paenibacillus sp. PCH8]|uniref:hypothetical protein n=1 Tax=Paenibacillus sp. PCH8 TaxID=2066524 RepID=UPI000CF9DF30|nr:hypothetical protein [Paenibacillus sp. PCH8]PQP80689.1 hypothetical protein C0Q44_25990 [Paenibacillus sp. PCH8]
MGVGRKGWNLKGRTIKLVCVGGVMIVVLWSLVACSASSLEQERKVYTREATDEGNMRAQSQGHGLNGALVSELREGFAARGIKLMNNMSADDGQGGISYMYLLNGSGRHIVKVHIFSDADTRAARMEEMYSERSDEAVLENALGRTTIRSKGYVSLVYSASGGEKDQYEQDVMQVFQQVLEQLK